MFEISRFDCIYLPLCDISALINIEGVIQRAIEGLSQDQEKRKVT